MLYLYNHRRAIYARVLFHITRSAGMIKLTILFYPVFSAIADGKPGTSEPRYTLFSLLLTRDTYHVACCHDSAT